MNLQLSRWRSTLTIFVLVLSAADAQQPPIDLEPAPTSVDTADSESDERPSIESIEAKLAELEPRIETSQAAANEDTVQR